MRGTKPHLREDRDAISVDMPPPDWLSEDAKSEWLRVVPILVERKILTEADLASLENYCVSIGTIREAERDIRENGIVMRTEKGARKNPAIAIQSDAMTRSRLLAAELGLTPVSRSRPAVRNDGGEDNLLLPLFTPQPGVRPC